MDVRNMPLEKGDAKWQNGVQLKLKQNGVKQNVNVVTKSCRPNRLKQITEQVVVIR